MPEPLSESMEIPPVIQTEQPADDKRRRWFELALVLLLCFGTSFIHSIYLLRYGPGASQPMGSFRYVVGIVQEIAGLLLLGYVLSRRALRFKDLGFRWSLRDVSVGLILFVASYFAYALGSIFISVFHKEIYGTWGAVLSGKDFFAHPPIVALPYTLLNPFFEELIVRAYLMTEVLELTGSSGWAVTLSVVVQSSYHLYYGWSGALSLSFLFLTLSLYYERRRRALPIIVAHAIFDIYAFVRLW
jgi:membrane protease YdiL (CAAX protease family)